MLLLQHPVLITLVRWLLAAIFLTSALGKLRDRRAFVAIILDYRVLPRRLARRFAGALPWIEIVVALMLLAGLGIRIAAALSGLLLFSFILAVGVNLARGRRDLDCGCTGARHRHKISGKIMLRNMLLLLLSLQVALSGQDSPVLTGWLLHGLAYFLTDILLVGAGLPLTLVVSGSLMLFLLFRQLIRFVQMESKP